MTSLFCMTVVPALFASALLAASPGRRPRHRRPRRRPVPRRAAPAGSTRARSARYRVGSIAGNSRRTRVTIFVNADRRYTFECAAGADGEVLTASLNPPASTRARGGAGSQGPGAVTQALRRWPRPQALKASFSPGRGQRAL